MNLPKPNSDYLERKSGYSCRGRSHASMNLFLKREGNRSMYQEKTGLRSSETQPSYSDFLKSL